MQKSTFFFYINFWSKRLLKISTFVHLCTKKCIKTKIVQNDQKMEKQMYRCDYEMRVSKIYVLLGLEMLKVKTPMGTLWHLCTKKCVILSKMTKNQKYKYLEVIMLQKSTFFFTIDFWSKPLLKFLTFVQLCTTQWAVGLYNLNKKMPRGLLIFLSKYMLYLSEFVKKTSVMGVLKIL